MLNTKLHPCVFKKIKIKQDIDLKVDAIVQSNTHYSISSLGTSAHKIAEQTKFFNLRKHTVENENTEFKMLGRGEVNENLDYVIHYYEAPN